TYAQAGTVNVGLTVTDDNADAVGPESGTASQSVTVDPAQAGGGGDGGGTGGGGPGGGPGGSGPDGGVLVFAPAGLTISKHRSLGSVLRSGLRLAVSVPAAATLSAKLRVSGH